MSHANTVTVQGRLTRDPDLQYISSGTALLKFTIANSVYNGKKDDHVNFFNCEMWGRMAEGLADYLYKGRECVVTGELRQDRWSDQNGNNRNKIKIIVQKFFFAGSDSSSQGGGRQDETGGSYQNGNTYSDDGFDDEVPF